MSEEGITLTVIARVPPDGLVDFQAYEDHVPPLVADHGGVVRRRLRSTDHLTEIHVVWFPSNDAFDQFRNDERRQHHRGTLERSRARTEILSVIDVS